MNKPYKKLSAWMILIGLFLQTSAPVVAAMQSSTSSSSNTVISGKPGVSVKMRSLESEAPESVDVANFNLQGLIEHVVEDAVKQGCEDKLSSALISCYKIITEGETVIDVDTLIEAMPELLQYAITQERMRAARPDAPSAFANNAIASCGGECDLTQVIQLLSSIRARIGTVNDNPCCNTILGILGDACNIPCIGENGSISEVLCEILDCCTTVGAEIKGIFTVLEDCCACEPIPLFQSDVDLLTNAIVLTTSGISYCLAENITGTISITGDNVTIEGNNRLVTGRIFINASEVVIKDTNVQAPGVLDSSEMSFAGIHIAGGSDNQIVNCVVKCNAAPGSLGVVGRTGIFSAGLRTRILRSEAVGGAGGFINAGVAGNGGAGIRITAATALVEDSLGIGGNGSQANRANSTGGNGGNGIEINGVNGLVNNVQGFGGTGGFAGVGSGGTGLNAGGNGAIGILLNGNNGIIKNSKGTGGNGNGAISGVGGTSGFGGNGIRMTGIIGSIENSFGIGGVGGIPFTGGIVGGAGGIGIDINGDKHAVRSSKAIGGSGIQGFGGGSGGVGLKIVGSNALINDATITGGDGGLGNGVTNGGGAGAGIQLPVGANFIDIFNSIVTGGNGGNGFSTGNGGDAGSGMDINIPNVRVADSEIRGGNGGNGGGGGAAGVGVNVIGASSNVTINGSTLIGGNGGAGSIGAGGGNSHALITQGNDVIVADSKLFAGDGANGATNGGNAGACVTAQSSSHVSLLNLSMVSGNGGNGGTGNGGFVFSCIDIFSMDTVIIKSCSIDGKGIGGNSTGGGNGGAGANGINIRGGSSNIQIEECVINNVGLGGTGAVSGANGNGIQIDSDSECVQVVSNRVACCPGIGINNDAGTESTFYNNIVTDCNPNYVNVPLIRVPGPHTGFFTNVTQGPQDCDLCDLFTVLVDIKDTLTECCAEIRSEIFDTQTLIIDGFEGTWTMIEDCCACESIPLFQSDVVAGEILLNTPGLNYCLAENVTATIIINGANVTLDGKDRVVAGRVVINGADIILKNTKVKPFAPLASEGFTNAGIEITAGAQNAQILHCLVECADNLVTVGTLGRSGIYSSAFKTIIDGCNVTAGRGNPSGGVGIQLDGARGFIYNSVVFGGSNSNVPGSNGGVGILITAEDGSVYNSTAQGGDALLAVASFPGVGIQINGISGLVDNCNARAGIGGTLPGNIGGHGIQMTNGRIESSIGVGNAGIELPGGNGIYIAGPDARILINNSVAVGGSGGADAGAGESGGHGILFESVVYAEINNSSATGGVGGAGTQGGSGASGGSGINMRLSRNISINNSTITPGNGGAGENLGGAGGNGILIQANSRIVTIKACTIIGGGVGGNGQFGADGNGGHGILIDSITAIIENVQVCDCEINNVGLAGGVLAIGGDGIRIDQAVIPEAPTECVQLINNKIVASGGNGINLLSASNVDVTNCSVVCNGLDGIVSVIGSDVVFDNCTALKNTGTGINIVNTQNFQVKYCDVESNGADGIAVATFAANGQVVTNRVNFNTTVGIYNDPLLTTIRYGNNASTNNGTNYGGANPPGNAAVTTAPAYWQNVF